MVTQINFNDESGIVLTSAVDSISANTTDTSVEVRLICENGPGDTVDQLYKNTLYSFGDRVELSGVGELVEEYFRRRNKITDIITVCFGDLSVEITFLYCEYHLPEAFDPDSAFYLASRSQRVYQDSVVTIAAADHGSATPFIIRAVGHNMADGAVTVVTQEVSKTLDGKNTAYFRVPDIITAAAGSTATIPAARLRDVMWFAIEYGGSQKMFYIVDAPAYLSFSFCNIFSVEETIDIAGIVTTKSEVDTDTAVVNGRIRKYNREPRRSYEVQSAAIPAAEIPLYEQFLASPDIRMTLEGNDYEVTIEDFTCEPSTSDESLFTVKFTWRFSDRRPRLFDTSVNGILHPVVRIFDATFTPEYE